MEPLTSRKQDLYLMIGSPISQVKSPAFFNDYFKEHNLDAELVALDISSEQLPEFFFGCFSKFTSWLYSFRTSPKPT